jgi:integrase
MRAVYNSAAKSGRKLPPNPCSGLAWFPQRPSREVVTDLRAFWRSIHHLSPIRRDFYLFVLFTGLRNRDACSIAWHDVRLETGTIHRPKPKGGERRAFTLPLSDVAKAILRRRKHRNETDFPDPSPWVFPAHSKSGHITEPKEEGVATPHSLRRTFATAAHAVGVDGWTIGVLLNHRPPSGSVTAGYVMPNTETLRKAVDSIGVELMRQLRALVRPYPGHG